MVPKPQCNNRDELLSAVDVFPETEMKRLGAGDTQKEVVVTSTKLSLCYVLVCLISMELGVAMAP